MNKIITLFKRLRCFFLRSFLTRKFRKQAARKEERALHVQPYKGKDFKDKCRRSYHESGCHNLRRAMAARYMKQGMSAEEAREKAKGISRTLAHKRKAWGL